MKPPRLVWATRSFLDYRVPVFRALSERVDGNLWLFYSGDEVPASVAAKAVQALGDHAVPLHGEWKVGREDRAFMANRNWSVRHQPGLWSQVRARRPDVLIGDGFFKWSFPLLLMRALHGTPLVLCYERTAHTERDAQRVRTWYRRWALGRTDAINCSGRLCRAYTEALGMPAARIREGHMVADVPRWRTEAAAIGPGARAELRQAWAAAGPVLLCVGRLTARKGCQPLIEAWARFEARHPDAATLVFVGAGELAAPLQDWCRAQGLRRVRFVGAYPHDALATAYAAADVLVLPTLEDNWSLVAPEAMACGLPVASSCYNGNAPELITEGQTGWVFDPLRPADVDRLLDAILAQRAALPAMGATAALRVQAFSPEAAADALLDSCRLALAQRGRPPC